MYTFQKGRALRSNNNLQYVENNIFFIHKPHCDEWGGAESRGNGASPGGVNDNERHPRRSPVLNPTEELWKDKRRSDDSGRREGTRPGFFCGRRNVENVGYVVESIIFLSIR